MGCGSTGLTVCTRLLCAVGTSASYGALRAATSGEAKSDDHDNDGPDPRNWSHARVRQWYEQRDSTFQLPQDAFFNNFDGRTMSTMHLDGIRDYYNKALEEHARALAEWKAMVGVFDGGSAGALLCCSDACDVATCTT